jgi:NADH dehydrogenase
MQEAKWAVANIARQMKGQPTTPFQYKDPGTMATIGRSAAVAEIKGLQLTGFFAWLVWLFVHLMNIVDFENRVVIFVRWAWAYLSWKRGARVVVGSEQQEQAAEPNLPHV